MVCAGCATNPDEKAPVHVTCQGSLLLATPSLRIQTAAADDDTLLVSYVFQVAPVPAAQPDHLPQRLSDYVVAKGTLRARRIPKDTMVIASNLSAMFDPWTVASPNAFRIDRPWDVYILFGYGLHQCSGEHINRAVIPQILKPLLKNDGLRRTPSAADRPFWLIGGRRLTAPRHFLARSSRAVSRISKFSRNTSGFFS